MNFVFTSLAKSDLEEIWTYIAEDNPDEASRFEADIYTACELLATKPEMGSFRPKWTNKPVRFWPVRKNYLIVYVTEIEPLEILRIFNAARDVPKMLNGIA